MTIASPSVRSSLMSERIEAPVLRSNSPVGSSAINEVGLVRQRARNGDALHLAARELVRPVVQPVRKADLFQKSARSLAPLVLRATRASIIGSSTFSNAVSIGQQIEALEHEADTMQSQRRALALVIDGDVASEHVQACRSYGASMQPNRLSSVVLPHPLGPIRATNSPGFTSRSNVRHRVDDRGAHAVRFPDAARREYT